MKIPESILKDIVAAKTEIVEMQGQEVYDAILAGKYPPSKIMQILIKVKDR